MDKCYEAMNDDFNSPILIAHIFDAVRFINGADATACGLSSEDLETLTQSINAFVFDVLGLEDAAADEGGAKLDEVMKMLIDMRARARADKDWALSDKIRDQLAEIGIQLKDGPEGTTYTLQ